MKPRLILVSLGVAILTILSLGQAQEGPKATKEDFAANQQRLMQQFKKFEEQLFKLKQNLARGTPEEKRRAQDLDKVLEECKKLAIDQEFSKMDELLKNARINSTDDLEKLKDQSHLLTERLRRIIEMIQMSDPDRLSKDRQDLQYLLKKLDQQIAAEKQLEALTKRGRTDTDELKKLQEAEAKKTADLAKAFDKLLDKDKNSGGKTGEAKPNGETKPGGTKEGKKGEAKGDGAAKENKNPDAAKGETKDGGKEGKDNKGPKGEAKPGDNKQGPPSKSGDNEPKAGAKPGAKSKEGSPKAGSKENKSGAKGAEGASKENKAGDKNPKTGQQPNKEGNAKDAGAKPGEKKDPKQQGQAKAGEDKKSSSAPSEAGAKDSPKSQAKSGDASGAAGKSGAKAPPMQLPADVKGGQAKGGDTKGGETKSGKTAGQAKTGSESSGHSQAKDGGASPSNGGKENPQQAQQPSQKGDGSPPPPPKDNNPSNKKDDQIAKSKKQIEEAGYDMKDASKNIEDKQKQAAVKNQADAIKKMEEAKKKLERLLQQLREDEIERVLAALQARCEKMLRMQQAVLDTTERTDKDIASNADKKPNGENKKNMLKLFDEEGLIVAEADKCIDILQSEGTAVAFPEVFQQIRQDMLHVQQRFKAPLHDVGERTQNIEKDIIENLKEMIEALKKARDDNKQDSPPPPPGGGGGGGQGDKKLIELIQELKMVRSLQKRLNDRTKLYGRDQEQSQEPQTIRELRNLSERQLRIQDIVSRIAKGDNK